MPRDFPDMNSLRNAARIHKFREPKKGENEDDFREALADHVEPIDFIESIEIRNKVGWDKFTEPMGNEMLMRAFIRNMK